MNRAVLIAIGSGMVVWYIGRTTGARGIANVFSGLNDAATSVFKGFEGAVSWLGPLSARKEANREHARENDNPPIWDGEAWFNSSKVPS